MLLVNTETIAGKEIETIGLVRGTMVQSKNIGRDIIQALKSLVGGELTAYTEMMNESRDIATQRMIEEAEKLGADAIVNVRYASSSIMKAASEILAYGTAVKFK